MLLFLGNVRDHHEGRRVEGITYHAYRPMAERRLAALVADLEAGAPELAVGIVHRLGAIPAGQTSVAIAVASPTAKPPTPRAAPPSSGSNARCRSGSASATPAARSGGAKRSRWGAPPSRGRGRELTRP